MTPTVNKLSARDMSQVDRHLFAHAEGNPDDADFDPERWVFVPDFPTELIRTRVFHRRSHDQLHEQYRALRARYDADRPRAEGEPERSLAGMIAWWREREACYPLVLSRQADNTLFLWDGCHRALHFILAERRAELPVLLGVGARPPFDNGKRYAPKCYLGGTEVTLERRQYGNGRVAIEAVAKDGPFAKLTVNLPNEPMGDDEAGIKNWSECEGFLPQLEKQGVVRRTGRVLKSGYVEVPTALILV